MQNGHYYLTEKEGQNFDSDFNPELTPKEMLDMGVFGGKYITDCKEEIPDYRFENVKLSSLRKNTKTNYFKVNASS